MSQCHDQLSDSAFQQAERKLGELHKSNAKSPSLHFIDLTMPPSNGLGCFPGLTPFRFLSNSDAAKFIVSVPSVRGTAALSAVFGAVLALSVTNNVSQCLLSVLSALRRHCLSRRADSAAAAAANAEPSALRSVGRWAKSTLLLYSSAFKLSVLFVAVLYMLQVLRRRLPTRRLIAPRLNVSSSPRGPCRVTDNIVMVTNSHAGTHSDNPHHFTPAPERLLFDDRHYSGRAVVVDLSDVVQSVPQEGRAITYQHIDALVQKLPCAPHDVFRVLIVTRRNRDANATTWDDDFAYFQPAAAERLCSVLPNLLVIATESASVDAPAASPIVEATHGVLYRNGVAILENVQAKPLYPRLDRADGVLQGELLTVFNPMALHEDARGCSVLFAPDEA